MTNRNIKKNKYIILASTSPQRKKILRQASIRFKVIKSNLNENLLIKKLNKLAFKDLAKVLALSKAVSALRHSSNKNQIVAGFDTLVICKDTIISKPKNKKDALNKLLFLSNTTHSVITGIAIVASNKKAILIDYEITKVKMKKIKKDEAIKYIQTGEPMNKAGGYAIQGKGEKFIKSIVGDYLNVVGLPLNKFILMLKKISGHLTTS